MSNPTTETKAPAKTTSTPATTTSSGGGSASGSSPKSALRGSSYDAGAAALAPPGAAGKGGSSLRSRLTSGAEHYSVGTPGHYGYITDEKTGERKRDPSAREFGYVRGGGKGYGNRHDDLEHPVDEKDPSKGKERPNGEVKLSDITGIPEPELDKLPEGKKKEIAGRFGTYAGYETAIGTARGASTDFEGKIGHDGEEGSLEISGPNAYYQAGLRGKAYAGIKGEAEGKLGTASGKAEAYASGYAGLSGKAGISDKGASAEGAIGAGVEIGVTADADLKTKGIAVDGVEGGVTAGVGVHGEAKAYAKAGAGGGAYLTKDKVGLWGSAGAAAVAEAKADVHGHLGPVGVTVEGGVMAGAGAGIEGGILYENGKLRIGGRMYAALGYGASFGGSVEIDLKQAYHIGAAVLKKAKDLGLKGAKAAFEMADADNDGKLSLNDAATHASSAMDSGAKKFERGVDGAINFLDGDGDGKFDFKKDMGARASQAKDAVVDTGKKVIAAGSEMVDRGKKAIGKAADRAYKAADIDGDGKLGMKDVSAGVEKAKAWAGEKFDEGAKWASDKKDEALAWGSAKIDEAKKAAEAVHKFADRTGDGKVGLDDVRAGAGEVYDAGKAAVKSGVESAGKAIKSGADWAKEKGSAAVDWASKKKDEAVEGVKAAGAAVHKAADRDGDGKIGIGDVVTGASEAKKAVVATVAAVDKKLTEGYATAKKTVEAGLKSAHDAADLNKDGKVDAEDAKIAAARAKAAAAAAAERARAKAAAAYKAAQDAKAALEKKAAEAIEAAKKAADRDGDGKLSLGDVKAGASQAYAAASAKASEVKTAVVSGAKAAYKSASEGISTAATTLSNGYNAASERVGAAWGRFSTFISGG
ncbi:MAG: hypothetical protein IT385_05675 [Deltaproteobacteria bacterium]|nr:hypothetical protein [Deltaproteobacteria bacterium]